MTMSARPEVVPAARRAVPARVLALGPDGPHERPDVVAGEEPLEIRLTTAGGATEPVGVTMRTPGGDFELAVGFLIAEGVLEDQRQVRTVRYCSLAPEEEQLYNIVTVETTADVRLGERARRFTVTSSCGVCGTASLDDLETRCAAVASDLEIDESLLVSLPERLRASQKVFSATGGLHAAGLFAPDGQMLAVREDVGRHNAVDKLVGWAALRRSLPLSGAVLVVSGRASFELVQKAAVAGIPVLVAVSAPSSLAVATAERFGVTLCGFVRAGRANLYTGRERVRLGR